MKKIIPPIALIISNSIPLFGVLFFDWNLFSIIFLYWLESGVIGFYNIFKLVKVIKNSGSDFGTLPFFIIHYGGFFAGHGFFIFALFRPAIIPIQEVIIAVAFMLSSHGISYVQNFIGRKEFEKVSAPVQMFKPYARVFIMHITILGGAILIQKFHEPIMALFLLIFLKTIIDLVSHFIEHIEIKEIKT